MALGLVLRRAYKEWLGEQLSGWPSAEVWVAGEPEPLKALAGDIAAVLFQARQLAALEAWLTAGYLPGDLATFEPEAANLILDPSGAISDGFVSLTADTDKGPPSVRETGRPYQAATPPFQASASASAFADHINPETPEKARAVEPAAESWPRQVKGLRDLAAFVQSNRQGPVDATDRFPGPDLDLPGESKTALNNTPSHISQTSSTPDSEAWAGRAPAPHRSQRARQGNWSLFQQSMPTGAEAEMESRWNFLKQTSGRPHSEPEMLLSRALTPDEAAGPSRSDRQVLGAANTGEPMSIKSGDQSSIGPLADSGPGVKVSSEPDYDSEKSLASQKSLVSPAPVDLEAILEAIGEEMEREFKRIYGR
jgi:hypothetical protein